MKSDARTHQERLLRAEFPLPRYRVQRQVHAAGTSGPHSTSDATCYLLAGACRFVRPGFDVRLTPGDCAHLPAGEYHFEALGDATVHIVHVWDVAALTAAVPLAERGPGGTGT